MHAKYDTCTGTFTVYSLIETSGLDVNVIMKTILYSINEWCIQAILDATLGTALWLYGFFSLNLGVEKLVGVYRERPNFADQDAQEDAKQRLCQVSQYRLYVQCI